MKYYNSLISFFFAFLLVIPEGKAQLSSSVSIQNGHEVDGNYEFDVILSTKLGNPPFFLAGSDFVFTFENQKFVNPVFSKVEDNESQIPHGYCDFTSVNHTDPSAFNTQLNVQFPANKGISVEPVTSGRLIISFEGYTANSQNDLAEFVPLIRAASTHRLGKFRISGIIPKEKPLFECVLLGIQRTKIHHYDPTDLTIKETIVSCATTLPVVLKYFKLNPEQNYLKLNWETFTETGFEGFFLERSTDGRDFQEISFFESKGSETSGASYQYKDRGIYPCQIYYYRLKMKDLSQSIEYSKTIQGELECEGMELSLGPNPAQNRTQVIFDSKDNHNVQISLYDSIGQRIQSIKHMSSFGFNKVELDLKDLAAGMYLVEVVQSDSKESSRLIILDSLY